MPIIIAGNKEDLGDTKREVYVEDVVDWVQQDYKLNRWNSINICFVRINCNDLSERRNF